MSCYLKETPKEKMEKRRALWQTAAALLFSLLITIGCVLWFPAKSPEQTPVQAGGTEKEISRAKDDRIRIINERDEKHRAVFTGGGSGSGGTMNWEDQFDFNIRCTGRPDMKRVTYTAHNCEFMKKTFFTKAMVDSGEYGDYGVHQVLGEKQGSEIYWGFAPVGYVYSADYLEEVNLTNFGLKVSYPQEGYKNENTIAAFKEQMKKISVLRKAAYEKVSITANIDLDDGSIITKTIRIRDQAINGQRTVLAYLAKN